MTSLYLKTTVVKERILWHMDPLLSNYRKANNETTAITRQPLGKHAKVLELLLGSGLHSTMEEL
jgi:hypothetical protein